MIVESNYDVLLVVLSYLISVFGSFTALQLAIRIPNAQGDEAKKWIVGAAVALGGCGIWSMHFIGMLAYKVPVQIEYSPLLTIISLIISVGVVAAGFYIVGSGDASIATLVKGGAVAGLGVAAMHYLGMYAMIMSAEVIWNMSIVALSIVIAVTAATVALWLAFNLRGNLQRFGSAFVMGIAVCGMHYTGMSALSISVDIDAPATAVTSGGVSNEVLGLAIFILTVVLLCSFLVLSTKSASEALAEQDLLFE